MLNIFKMDLRRFFRSKAFYSCIFSMLLISGSMIFFGMLPDFAAATGSSSGTTDMTSSMMGVGMAFIMMSVLFAICISTDFTSGFSKNIFSKHTNPARYIGGKILSLTILGAIMIVMHTVVSMLLFAITGGGVELTGGLIGLLTYLIEKTFVASAFASLILMVFLFSRHIAPAMIIGVVAATGSISMLLTMAGTILDVPLISKIAMYTLSGLSGQATLKFNATAFFTIVIGSVLWIAVCSLLGAKALKRKDIL